MLNRILQKRTRMEIEAWQGVRNLMPRNRKTRGIQYETLEYLFSHLYQRVPEEDLEQYLRERKGHLQKTGDPVKGAINQAVKELQRLPDRPFELIKIQESTVRGPRRLVQLNYKRFEEVISYDLYIDYLQDVLENEENLIVRGISHPYYGDPAHLFPGCTVENLATCKGEFLITPGTHAVRTEGLTYKYIPKSSANLHLLLIYENKKEHIPFLAFLASNDRVSKTLEFILFRGEEKKSKLRFLDHIWQNLHRCAIDESEMEKLAQQARDLTESGIDHQLILDGLIAHHCHQVR